MVRPIRASLALCFATAALWAAPRATFAEGSQGLDEPDLPSTAAGPDGAYREALRQSLEAHERGDLQRALRAMEHAHELQPSARTLRGLGVLALADGRPREAARYLQASLDDGRRALTSELRDSVKQRLRECFGEFSRVRLEASPAEASVRIDGRLPVREPSGEVWLTSGVHQLEVRADGYVPQRFSRSFEPGVVHHLAVRLSRRPAPMVLQASLPSAAATAEPRPDRRRLRVRRSRSTLLVAGGALLSTGLATWLTALVRFGQVQRSCDGACSDERASALWERENLDTLSSVATAFAVSGGALLLAGSGLRLWEHRSDKRGGRLSLRARGAGVALVVRH